MATKINVEGRRLVKEAKIAEIGQTGPEYTAGEGIVISEDEISVDEQIIATKTDLGDYETKANSDQKAIIIEYIKTPADVLAELQVTDPEATNQDAITAWIKGMPVLLGEDADGTEQETLEAAGFTNIINGTNGYQGVMKTQFDIFGYYILPLETGTDPKVFDNGIRIFGTDIGSNATQNIWTRVPARRCRLIKSGGTDYVAQGARFRSYNNYLESYTDPFNNAVYVQGFTNNTVNDALLTTKNTVVEGRSQEAVSLFVDNPVANINLASQLKLPTTEGTYQLTCNIDANGKFTSFAWVLIS